MRFAMLSIGLATAALPALAEQAGVSGRPLAQYCNTVPELSTARSDAVDNWVKICTVWFNANRPSEPRPPEPRPPRDDARSKER